MTFDIAKTSRDLLEMTRENKHRVFVLYRCHACLGQGGSRDWGGDWEDARRSGAAEGAPRAEPSYAGWSAELSARELMERIYEGAGLVNFSNDPDEIPELEKALGLTENGPITASSINIVAIAPSGPLNVSGRFSELRLTTASPVATVQKGRKRVPVAASNSFGRGLAITATFDPELAPSKRMTEVVASLLGAAARVPAPQRVPLEHEVLDFTMWSQSSASVSAQLVVSLPPRTTAEYADPPALSLTPPTWRLPLAPQESWTGKLGIELPDGAGENAITAEADWLSNEKWQSSAQVSIAIPTARSGSQLVADAKSALKALKLPWRDEPSRVLALAALSALDGPAPESREEAEVRIEKVLDAITATTQIRSVDTTHIRMIEDPLLRYWELRWTELSR